MSERIGLPRGRTSGAVRMQGRSSVYAYLMTPGLLADEHSRRWAVKHIRERAEANGYTGRLRFVRGPQTGREFIENRPAPIFLTVALGRPTPPPTFAIEALPDTATLTHRHRAVQEGPL